jgi:hypothetical protein
MGAGAAATLKTLAREKVKTTLIARKLKRSLGATHQKAMRLGVKLGISREKWRRNRNQPIGRYWPGWLSAYFSAFEKLLSVISVPYEDQPAFGRYADPPRLDQVVHQTFCGTWWVESRLWIGVEHFGADSHHA